MLDDRTHIHYMNSEKCPDETELNSYFDGEIPDDDMARVREHIAQCSTCASEIDALGRMAEFLPQIDSTPPTFLCEALQARVCDALQTEVILQDDGHSGHIKSCNHCQSEIKVFQQLSAMLAECSAASPAELRMNIARSTYLHQTKRPALLDHFIAKKLVYSGVLCSAILLAAGIHGIIEWRHPTDKSVEQVEAPSAYPQRAPVASEATKTSEKSTRDATLSTTKPLALQPLKPPRQKGGRHYLVSSLYGKLEIPVFALPLPKQRITDNPEATQLKHDQSAKPTEVAELENAAIVERSSGSAPPIRLVKVDRVEVAEKIARDTSGMISQVTAEIKTRKLTDNMSDEPFRSTDVKLWRVDF